MKRLISALISLLLPVALYGQSEVHVTQFMWNKMLYNPAYAGYREQFVADVMYRDQWSGIKGSPKAYSFSVDGPVGKYNNTDIRPEAVSINISSETIGIEKKQTLKGGYAVRIGLVNGSVLSFGVSGGALLYSTDYSQLDPYQLYDPKTYMGVNKKAMVNGGLGVFWSADRFYLGLSVPNVAEDYYYQQSKTINGYAGRQTRGFYLMGGYTLNLNEKLYALPQFLVRYIGNSAYGLPVSADLNATLVFRPRFMMGLTCRTDRSLEAMMRIQAMHNISIGYSYDYMTSSLAAYAGGAHEISVGISFLRDHGDYLSPEFIKRF